MRKSILKAIFLLLICGVLLAACGGEPQRISVHKTHAASIEYAGEAGYRLITSEVSKLWSLDSLLIEPTEEPFSGDWIYRLTYEPDFFMEYGRNIVVLFGEKNLSLNGETYTAAPGVDYADILAWAEGKYKYFTDYPLYTEPDAWKNVSQNN
ncbi:MAG: hypothetical protein E7662_12825 [Ruminococcaceae bacterium]|nr:hypothetical protein [Oscillospiraceae bacterium]